MLLQVRHALQFTYSQPVFCEPLVVRLRPREDGSQSVLDYRLDIWPPPSGTSEHRDLEGNSATCVWFDGLRQSLSVSASLIVETCRRNPFDFVLRHEALTVPMKLRPRDAVVLEPYARRESICANDTVFALASAISRASQHRTVAFLTRLAAYLHQRYPTIVRPDGEPWPAEHTLSERCGSSRDLTVLYCEVCRAMGIPTRFVSGYLPRGTDSGEQHLHAWSEVYLPGAGWRGFDPSLGLATADGHVAAAAGRTFHDAAPCEGVFRGTGARSTLKTQLHVGSPDAEAAQPRLARPAKVEALSAAR